MTRLRLARHLALGPLPDHRGNVRQSAHGWRLSIWVLGYRIEEHVVTFDVHAKDAGPAGSQDHPGHLAGVGEDGPQRWQGRHR